MNISLNWLNTYLDQPVDTDEAERVLTSAGFPFDGLHIGENDALLDIEITSNRPDCLSHLGIAREIAAATDRQLVPPAITPPTNSGAPVTDLTSVEIRDHDRCPAYTARVITGVKVAPSPDWLVERLEAVGLRAVNNIVDITNFVLHELGQPLHAFDFNKLEGKKIVVRQAVDGEHFTAIDGTRHELKSPMLVIADEKSPCAIAGVMGGLDSEVSEDTTDILLESARFEALSVRSTSR
ncbi:MAG: phenylalanine--tRNA ligase beta subunit-related protein, partial [Planctomycetota bacterium]